MFGIGGPEFTIILVIVVLIPFYKIFSKAGFPGLLCLTMIVPLLNVIMLFYLAYAKWPIHKEITKACPYCSETIKIGAIKCRFCGEMLGHDEEPLQVEI